MLTAADAALRAGFAGAELDTAGTLALAVAAGAAPDAAAHLIGCYQQGLVEGLAERRDQQPAPSPPEAS